VPDVSLSYSEMQQVKSVFEQNAQQMEEALSNLLKLTNQLTTGPFKTDRASPAFMQSYQNIHKGGQQVMQGIQGLGQFLGSAVQGAQQLDQQLAQQLSKGG
jgi:uncharacterized protein YukE